MDPEVKELWVAALRGGKYTQGLGRLRTLDGGVETWCCLGVLCNLAEETDVIGAPEYLGPEYQYEGFASALPPGSVEEWAGIDALNTRFPIENPSPDDSGDPTLVALNDSGKYSFAMIADVIEEYL